MVLIVVLLLADAALHPGCDYIKIGMSEWAAITTLPACIQWIKNDMTRGKP
jgi:hypothetical protein